MNKLPTPRTVSKNTSFKIVANGNGFYEVHSVGGSSYRWGLELDEALEYVKGEMLNATKNAEYYQGLMK